LTDTNWTGRGLSCAASTSKVTVTDAAELQIDTGTLIVFGDFDSEVATTRFISKRAPGTSYEYYIDASGNLEFFGDSASQIATDVNGTKYISVNFEHNTNPEFFIDGASIGNGDASVAVTVSNDDLYIGNNSAGGKNLKDNLKAALIVNRKLTAPEHLALYNELVALRWSNKPTKNVIQNLISEGALVLYHDYRSGSAYDWSGNSNDGTLTDTNWTGRGLAFPATTSVVTVADSPELQLAEVCLVALGEFNKHDASSRIISKRDAGGINYEMYLNTATRVFMVGNGSDAEITQDVSGATCISVQSANNEISTAWLDGVSLGNMDDTILLSADDAPLKIGNFHSGGHRFYNTLQAALIVNRKLTAGEHLALYNELVALRWPTKTSHRFKGNNEILNGNFKNWTADDPDDWTVFGTEDAGSYITESSQRCNLVSDGDNIGIQQTTLTAGRIYEVIINVISLDTTLELNMVSGSNVLINSTGLKRYKMTAGTSAFQIKRNVTVGAVNCIFDNVSVRPWHGSWMTGYGAHESSGNTTAGYLENTPFQVQSGSFKVSVQTVNNRPTKVIECVTDGTIGVSISEFNQTGGESAYGTWDIYINKGNTANNMNIGLGAQSLSDPFVGDIRVQFKDNETLRFVKNSVIKSTSTTTYNNNTWYKLTVTRNGADLHTYYIDDVLVPTSSTNPFTDASVTSVNYIALAIDAGDMIALASFDGQHAISKAVV
jgi:hypothetical protein